MEVRIDITDWAKEYKASGVKLESREDLLEQATEHTPLKLGRLAVVARERTGAEVLPPNKLLLNLGAAVEVQRIIREARIEDEETGLFVRRFVGPLGSNDGRYVEAEEPAALKRAREYLRKYVPAHARRRFELLAYHGTDLRGPLKELIATLEDIVAELEQRVSEKSAEELLTA